MFTISTAKSRISTINRIFPTCPLVGRHPPQDWIPHDARWSKEYFEKAAGAAAQFAQRDGRKVVELAEKNTVDANSVSRFFPRVFLVGIASG